uniref:NTF2 domain-containing protein n=1 Tax=Mucochytrium quahogii TaxID=96639 RepID=A0A7S2S5S6_9STRA
MGDPNTVGKAFLEAYYAALDKNASNAGNFYQAASTLSFEGKTVNGQQAITQEFAGLGLPPNAQRRITATDAQNSCCGNGALLIFCTGEWMGHQYQEVFQLVPTGGSYYIHNCICRIGINTSNSFNVPAEAVELTKGFVQHYYSQYDGGLDSRAQLQSLYTNTSVVSIEGTTYTGTQNIMEKFKEMPIVQNDPNMLVDVHCVNGLDIVLIFLAGQLSIDGQNPMKFAQTFLIQKSGGSYIIGNQTFRLNYG